MATTKRKLPVLQNAPEGAAEVRPPWQWVAFGALMIFTAWLPLAYVGAALVAPGTSSAPGSGGGAVARLLIATALPLMIAAGAGGFLVSRFGEPAGAREATLAGLVTGLVAVAMTALSGPFSPLFLLVVVIATAFAWAGGAVGARQRRRRGPLA
jgi:hypothetical protein